MVSRTAVLASGSVWPSGHSWTSRAVGPRMRLPLGLGLRLWLGLELGLGLGLGLGVGLPERLLHEQALAVGAGAREEDVVALVTW
jgi:hypothetical protein